MSGEMCKEGERERGGLKHLLLTPLEPREEGRREASRNIVTPLPLLSAAVDCYLVVAVLLQSLTCSIAALTQVGVVAGSLLACGWAPSGGPPPP